MPPTNITIKASPFVMNITPYGFFYYGKEFFNTAKAYNKSDNYSPVPYYLYCHAIELFLKAFLLSKGVSIKDLKNHYGHFIDKILIKAKEFELDNVVSITNEQEREIKKANEYYAKKGFEYFDLQRTVRAYPCLPNLSHLEQMAETLLIQLEPICINAN